MHGGAALLCGLLAAGVGTRAVGQRPSFSVKSDAVLVDVLVTANGRPVTDLAAADFTVRDNGTPQRVELLNREDVPQNLFLIVDIGSDAVVRAFDRFSRAANRLVQRADPRDRIGLLVFSHRIHLASPLTTDRAAILRRFVPTVPDRASAVADALFAAAVLSRAESGRSIALVFTQGDDTASWLSDAEALAAVRRSNLMVYGVTLRRPPDQRVHGFIIGRGADGLTVQEEFDRTHSSRSNGGNGDVLRRAAEMTGGRVLDGDSAHLDDILSGVADEFRARYVLAFRPTTPSPGWHDLSVRVARRGVTVSARRGYAVGR